ncbi:hypothetical protein [Nisaea sp.]|uniref:hypothetical protein n=1 Tax=Nisaea sp. TaxID=2024842 RepID=UPI003B52DFCC
MSVVDGHFSSTPTKLALWDLREASLSAFRADEISSLVEAGARHLERRGAGAKTAVVTAGEWDEALLRVYEARALAALGEVRFRVFNDADRAREWLCDPA